MTVPEAVIIEEDVLKVIIHDIIIHAEIIIVKVIVYVCLSNRILSILIYRGMLILEEGKGGILLSININVVNCKIFIRDRI